MPMYIATTKSPESNKHHRNKLFLGPEEEGEQIESVTMTDCKVTGARFESCFLTDFSLQEVKFSENCEFSLTHLDSWVFSGEMIDTLIENSSTNRCRFVSVDFIGVNFEGGNVFVESRFVDCKFHKCTFKDIKFDQCVFNNCTFSECKFLGQYTYTTSNKRTKVAFNACSFEATEFKGCAFYQRANPHTGYVVSDVAKRPSTEFPGCSVSGLVFYTCSISGLQSMGLENALFDQCGLNQEGDAYTHVGHLYDSYETDADDDCDEYDMMCGHWRGYKSRQEEKEKKPVYKKVNWAYRFFTPGLKKNVNI